MKLFGARSDFVCRPCGALQAIGLGQMAKPPRQPIKKKILLVYISEFNDATKVCC